MDIIEQPKINIVSKLSKYVKDNKFSLDTRVCNGGRGRHITLGKKLDKYKKIDENTRCWNWIGSTNNSGAGQIRINNKLYLVSRLSLSLYKNFDLNSKLFVLHNCDNPSCFNPEHLRAGTQTDNMKDCLERKRSKKFTITHCPKGHEYTKENTYIGKSGSRFCRTCQTIHRQTNYLMKEK